MKTVGVGNCAAPKLGTERNLCSGEVGSNAGKCGTEACVEGTLSAGSESCDWLRRDLASTNNQSIHNMHHSRVYFS